MRLKLALAVTILLAAAVLVALQMRSGSTPSTVAESDRSPAAGSEISTSAAADSAASEEAAVAPADSEGTGEEPAAPTEPAAFKQWMQQEARQMDNPSVDSERKSREINAIAEKLTEQQRGELLKTARNPSAPAGEKILSTYMLVRAGARATQDLKALITTPVAETGPAHSEAELANVRDKTLRIMAVDGLMSRAQTDPQAREALAKTIDEIQDPYVKDYARKQLERVQRQ